MSILLSGNEAIALGFLHSNGSFASGYPGTPSTEIIESLLQYKKSIVSGPLMKKLLLNHVLVHLMLGFGQLLL